MYLAQTNTHTHRLCGSCSSYIFHVTFHVTLGSTGQQTSAVSWKNDVSLCVWAPWESRGVSTAADLMTLFAASWTPTGTRWNCSNGSRTIQSLMRRTTHTVSRSTVQSLLRGQGKVIKYLQWQLGTRWFNQTRVKYLIQAIKNQYRCEFHIHLIKMLMLLRSTLELNLSEVSFSKPKFASAALLRCKMASPPKHALTARVSLESKLLLKQGYVFCKLLKGPCFTHTEKWSTFKGGGEEKGRGEMILVVHKCWHCGSKHLIYFPCAYSHVTYTKIAENRCRKWGINVKEMTMWR